MHFSQRCPFIIHLFSCATVDLGMVLQDPVGNRDQAVRNVEKLENGVNKEEYVCRFSALEPPPDLVGFTRDFIRLCLGLPAG